ncbi:ABC transporter permease [Angustibacter luteus]|uniref:ABC transporter permease n=1 Tax=Angustibacter luteus TaxID=658456 RepID=A0ABW1JGH3_9ACTN
MAVFLVVPTAVVVVQAFRTDDGAPTLGNVRELGNTDIVHALVNSVLLSGVTAIVGAALGAVVAYAVVTAAPEGLLRRVVTAASGVLAQFGGVMLAFAWIATLGLSGLVPTLLRDHLGTDVDTSWLYGMSGFMLVYLYFQIPLMVIVFLPSLDGVRPQWREATESLGGTTWQYWRRVAGPLLAPAFFSSTLLLFANALSAYATAAALNAQSTFILPLQIGNAIGSEVVLGRQNVAKALALEMVVIVAIIMVAYAFMQRRADRWLAR